MRIAATLYDDCTGKPCDDEKIFFHPAGFSSQDIIDAVCNTCPMAFRLNGKQCAYLSSILSKNEINKDDRYNRKLFYRVMRGIYVFNPGLALKVESNWINIYDLLAIDKPVD
ncbi:MAG: hypothetical protein KIT26_06495 [Nitrosomonas sp.]|nr:hypothetical protein [Nitrosomonas sp.]